MFDLSDFSDSEDSIISLPLHNIRHFTHSHSALKLSIIKKGQQQQMSRLNMENIEDLPQICTVINEQNEKVPQSVIENTLQNSPLEQGEIPLIESSNVEQMRNRNKSSDSIIKAALRKTNKILIYRIIEKLIQQQESYKLKPPLNENSKDQVQLKNIQIQQILTHEQKVDAKPINFANLEVNYLENELPTQQQQNLWKLTSKRQRVKNYLSLYFQIQDIEQNQLTVSVNSKSNVQLSQIQNEIKQALIQEIDLYKKEKGKSNLNEKDLFQKLINIPIVPLQEIEKHNRNAHIQQVILQDFMKIRYEQLEKEDVNHDVQLTIERKYKNMIYFEDDKIISPDAEQIKLTTHSVSSQQKEIFYFQKCQEEHKSSSQNEAVSHRGDYFIPMCIPLTVYQEHKTDNINSKLPKKNLQQLMQLLREKKAKQLKNLQDSSEISSKKQSKKMSQKNQNPKQKQKVKQKSSQNKQKKQKQNKAVPKSKFTIQKQPITIVIDSDEQNVPIPPFMLQQIPSQSQPQLKLQNNSQNIKTTIKQSAKLIDFVSSNFVQKSNRFAYQQRRVTNSNMPVMENNCQYKSYRMNQKISRPQPFYGIESQQNNSLSSPRKKVHLSNIKEGTLIKQPTFIKYCIQIKPITKQLPQKQ